MNIAICDDEGYVRAYIRELIGQQEAGCKISEFSSGQELLESLGLGNGDSEPPSGSKGQEGIDILFLDISMAGLGGMDVARKLRSRAGAGGEPILGSLPLIIFVSGYPEYAVEAFSVHAFQFLVKPISEKEFQEVFGQAVREYRCLAGKKRPAPKELLVRAGNTTRKVLAGDIYYVESSNRKVILCLGNEKITFYGRISQLQRELQEQFFRVHKGYLVNMEHVERYSRTEVWMKNGDRALISKYKYQDFVKAYLKFISEGCH